MKNLKAFFENYMNEFGEYYMASQPCYWCSVTRFETADGQNEQN